MFRLRGVSSPNLGFDLSFLHNGTKQYINFLTKKIFILHFGFWQKEPKRASGGSHKDNKFYILNRTKYNLKNFNILQFCILYFMGTKHPVIFRRSYKIQIIISNEKKVEHEFFLNQNKSFNIKIGLYIYIYIYIYIP